MSYFSDKGNIAWSRLNNENSKNTLSSFPHLLSGGVRITAMTKNCHNDYKMKFSVDDEFPDLTKHNNHMAKVQILLWHGLNMDTLLPHTWA